MMLKVAKLGIVLAAVLAWIVPAAYAGVPDVTQSFYVPQVGSTASPTEGTVAVRFFRQCPDNDGGSALPLNARIKVVALDVNGNGIPNIAAADICVLFNGGLVSQGFNGIGADSIISNSANNPTCPDLRCVSADAPTDASGTTYITFIGGDVNNPGTALRNSNRKWGHYDTVLPVYILGFPISGRLTTGSANGTYTLRIKNMDLVGGTAPSGGGGMLVSIPDFNFVANGISTPSPFNYWQDLDSLNNVGVPDFNLVVNHFNHTCTNPLNP